MDPVPYVYRVHDLFVLLDPVDTVGVSSVRNVVHTVILFDDNNHRINYSLFPRFVYHTTIINSYSNNGYITRLPNPWNIYGIGLNEGSYQEYASVMKIIVDGYKYFLGER